MPRQALNVPGQNRLLASLPPDVHRRLEPSLEKVSLALKETVYEAEARMAYVHFPLSGVISLVLTMEDGGTIEVGTIGNEGMLGTTVLLGADRSPTRAFCQVPGEALRMPAERFAAEIVDPEGALRRIVSRYAQAFINQVSQSVACNHLHSVEQRACRWLLMTHDRIGHKEFPLTQEFLAQMLGVRRPSVTIAAGLLERAGLITYRRGRITILDRDGLESATCECYHVVRREYERLLGDT